MCVIFFFSSRRRHTRYWRDWSSDVCSSDLRTDTAPHTRQRMSSEERKVLAGTLAGTTIEWYDFFIYAQAAGLVLAPLFLAPRSEERRVGKECRSRWSPYH